MTTILVAVVFVVACVALLAVKVIFVKGGEFPRTHISQSAAMRERGITCVESQDLAERCRRGLYDDCSPASLVKRPNNITTHI